MKKVLILTVTAGNGHNACAKGMKEKLEKLGDVQVKIVDVLKEYSSKLNVWTADKGYNIAMQFLPSLYNRFYNNYKNKPAYKRYSCAGQGYAMSIMGGLLKEIYNFKPDVIYNTHFYGAIAITNLRKVYDIPCKVIVTSLDYTNSPFWEAAIGVDYLAIPNSDFTEEYIQEGFKKDQLLITGIPVKEQFFEIVSKEDARNKLNLEKNLFTIMVIFGGGHWGGGFRIFKDLLSVVKDQNIQIIMINGKNKNSFKKIAKMRFPKNIKVINVGFTDMVDLYISASDIVITKLGGLSSTEMINKRTPMIVTSKVYGQERHNLNYLKQKGVVLSFNNKKQLKNNIFMLKNNKQFYDSIVNKMNDLRTSGINYIAEFIMNQPKAVYDEDYINKIDYNKVKNKVKKVIREADRLCKKQHKKGV